MTRGRYEFRDFLPLVVVMGGVVALSVAVAVHLGASPVQGMQVFMGVFFVVFGLFKVVRLRAFAKAYQMYDILAARSVVYAYAYPFIEIALGTAYLVTLAAIATPPALHIVTATIMLIGAAGVYGKLRKRERIMCVCLGAVFTIPMTWVTLFEDLLMAGMAVYMLVG